MDDRAAFPPALRELMTVRRDQSYLARMPADIKELVKELHLEVPDPVWTVGRVDERQDEPAAPEQDTAAQPDD